MKNNNGPVFNAILSAVGEDCGGRNYWLSIGADPKKRWTERYLYGLMSIDMAKNSNVNSYDVPRKKTTYTEEEKIGLKKYAPARNHGESIFYLYPPHLQETLKFFVKMFNIDISSVPDQHYDKSEYGLWIKELDELKSVSGKNIQSVLLRTVVEYEGRYTFKITRPRQAIKITKTARKHLEEEWNNSSVPIMKDVETVTKKSLLELFDEL